MEGGARDVRTDVRMGVQVGVQMGVQIDVRTDGTRPGWKNVGTRCDESDGGDGCQVCGNGDVVCDAVEEMDEMGDCGLLNLAECGRCHHRWTWRSAPLVAVSEVGAQGSMPPGATSPGAGHVLRGGFFEEDRSLDEVASAA
jgi:hypothetical protein